VLDSDSQSRVEVSQLIEDVGGMVVVASPPRPDSVDLLRRMEPDAVLVAVDDVMARRGVGAPSPALDLSAAIVLVASAVRGLALRAARAPGVMGALLRPLRPEEVGPTLDIAVARFRDLRRLRRALADRPLVEEAKARLMARDGLSEPAAFGWLRRRAMEQRVPIGSVARRVLERARWEGVPTP
jgi:response regulator NasT